MSYSVLNAKQELTGILHGTNLNKIQDIAGIFNRTARQILLDIDPQETKRIQQFVNPIYNSIYDYAVPVDLKGNRVVDIRPQANRNPNEVLVQNYNQFFDLSKKNTSGLNFTINFNTGVKTIRINNSFLPPPVVVNQCDNTTDNGTWSSGGSASNLSVNNVRFVSAAGSLQFDLAASGSQGYLENSTMESVDLTEQYNQGALFLWVYLPTGSDFSSITLRWGTNSSSYYSVTVTTTQVNTSFVNGWNLLAFNWLGATVVGTPDYSDISYVRVTYTYNGTAQTAVGLDSIASILGNILEIEYYSSYLFSTSTGTWQETVTDDSNLINLATESYNLFLNKLAYFCCQQQQGIDAAGFDAQYFAEEYEKDLIKYKYLYKSEVQKPQSVYYKKPNPWNRPIWWRGGN
jgi:hypothetical protein